MAVPSCAARGTHDTAPGCCVSTPLTLCCWQSGTRNAPTAGALATRGLTGRGFTCAYRVLGVVRMQHRCTVTRPDQSSTWPAELEALIREEWPSPVVGPGLAYLRDIRHSTAVHVYRNCLARAAPPGLYMVSRPGTTSWSTYAGQDLTLLGECEVQWSC